jgi:hypothetical protein
MVLRKGMPMISGSQIRAARGFLCWDRGDLANASITPLRIVEEIETADHLNGHLFTKELSAIRAALEAEGIEFIENESAPGVRLHQMRVTPEGKPHQRGA